VRGVGNAAHLGLVRLSEDIDEAREVLSELWAEWCWPWCCGEHVRAQQSQWRRRWPAVAAKEKEESKKWKCGAGRLTGGRCGFNWRTLAQHGLSRQAASNVRHHAAVNFCNRSDYCSSPSVKQSQSVSPN